MLITTDLQAKKFKPTNKDEKPSAGKAMHLLVKPNGSKYWRMSYRFNKKQKIYSIGVYPEVSLKEAKEKRDEARKLLSQGIDPNVQKKQAKLTRAFINANSFEEVAREWHQKQTPTWSDSHAKKLLSRFENDVFPWLGDRPIDEITPMEVLGAMKRIEDRGAIESAHRAMQTCGQVFRYGVATGRASRDICADLKGALTPYRKKHYPAITSPKELAPLLRGMKEYKGSLITRTALQILPHIFIRSGELRHAEWEEIDFDKRLWIIPSHRMKVKNTGIDHIIPLSEQVIELFEELRPLTEHRSKYVFHGARSTRRPLCENTIGDAIKSLGYKDKMTPHGFRATARTLLDEVLEYPPHLIEHQLAHKVKDSNGRAYNRTTHLDKRQDMMQAWSNYLDNLANEAQ